MDAARGADTPQDQREGREDGVDAEQPQPELRLDDTPVSPCQLHDDPVAQPPDSQRCDTHAQ